MKYIKKRLTKSVLTVILVLLLNLIIPTFAGAAELKMNSSYIYFGSASGYSSAVSNTQNALSQVYPSYFDLNPDGSLRLTPSVSQRFIDDMHAKGLKVVPFLSNHWNRTVGIAALNNRITLASQLAAAIERYNLDGVNIDIENLTKNERDNYVDFVRLLRAAMPAEKEISVAVAANPYGTSDGWQGSYDYPGLAKYSNYLVIMAYDEHYETGHAGPVASIPFVEKSIQYAVKNVSSDKVVLALPFYGRIWRDGGGAPNGYGISNKKTDQLIIDYGGKRFYDSTSKTSYAKIIIRSGDIKPVIGGKTLTTGTYTIWYADESTTKETLKLIQKYNLKGATSWSLGQESANTWSYFKLWLNGCYFDDIENHWARDSIFSAYQTGWVNGVTEAAYKPNGELTRAQAAVMLVRMLGLPIGSPSSEAEDLQHFDDTSGHWAQTEIETAHEYNLIDGVGDNKFDPNSPVTREQMAVMLYNVYNKLETSVEETEVSIPVFRDLTGKSGTWSYDAILTVSQKGIYNGYEDGTFRPKEKMTRAQMAVVLGRLSQADLTPPPIA